MEIRKRKWLAYLMVPVLAVAISCKDDDDDDDDDNNGGNPVLNEDVMEEISQMNLAEIEFGSTASTRAVDTIIQQYGLMMVSDHDMAQEELDSLAELRDLNLELVLKDEHQQINDSLAALSGTAFDSAYIYNQIMMHTETRNMFESIADTTTDEVLKNYVNKYLPVIILHLEKADSIADAFGMGNGGNNGGGNDTTDVGNDTTDVGNDTTDVGNDTTDVGNDTTDVGNDTTDVGNDTTDVGNDTADLGYIGADGIMEALTEIPTVTQMRREQTVAQMMFQKELRLLGRMEVQNEALMVAHKVTLISMGGTYTTG